MLQKISPPNIKPDATSVEPSSPSTGEIAKAVALLFEVFAARFGHRWTRTYEDPLARKVWARDLANEGLTAEEINHGLRNGRAQEWPPTIGEFIAQCRLTATELGLPEAREAYLAACSQRYPHPIVYHVAGLVGRYELRCQPEAKTWPKFEGLYMAAIDEARRGRVFTPPPAPRALPPPPPPSAEDVGQARAIFQETVRKMRQGRL